MSELDTKLAKEFLDVMKTVSAKTFDSKSNILKTALAVVIDASDSITPTIRLLSSPSDGSQDFEILNMSGELLTDGDAVWVNYWDGFTNAYISVKNGTYAARPHASEHKTGEADELDATDIGAMPYASVSTNLLINGGFDVWQRGTSFSAGGYTADRWGLWCDGTGATRAITRQAFTVGQTDVPSNPTYFLRYNQSAAGSGGTHNLIEQRVEGVRVAAGQTITLSFYAKADSAKSLTTVFTQGFGSGGSSYVYTSGVAHAVTTAWKKFTATVTIPSISGKTIGANNYLAATFAFPQNATFTFDIANVQLNYGSVALPFVPRSYAEELRLCQRYYLPDIARFAPGVMISGQSYLYTKCPTPVTMRTTPTLTLVTADAAVLSNGQVLAVSSISGVAIYANGIYFGLVMSSNATEHCVVVLVNTVINADAEL